MKCKEAYFVTDEGSCYLVLWYQYPSRSLSVQIQQLLWECVYDGDVKMCACFPKELGMNAVNQHTASVMTPVELNNFLSKV